MKTVVIVQARMGSSRLPGKVMLRLGDATVLGWVIRRGLAARGVDQLVVATTHGAEDDVLVDEARRHGAAVYRGSVDNVLSRYCGAARAFDADVVVRVTSDCPLFDPDVLSAMLGRFSLANIEGPGIDYLSNAWGRRTWPRGLDAEVFSRAALERCCEEAWLPWEHEHVTPYICSHPELFAIEGFASPVDLSRHRWTLDTPDDWALISAIHERLQDGGRLYRTAEILAFLDAHPAVVALNAHVMQKKLGE